MEYLKGNQNGFFAVNKYSFYRACDLGMNAAVAYLVLSTGTDKSNTFTSWSTHAIETYTGISRKKAQEAIDNLINHGLVKKISEDAKRPRYELIQLNPTPPKSKKKKGEPEPPPPDKLDPKLVIWLPNGIVQSVTGECPPVERIRQTQDVMILRLFVDLYSEHDLVNGVGVSKYVFYQDFKREKIKDYAEYTIYGFNSSNQGWMSWGNITLPHKETNTKKEEQASSYFQRIHLLIKMGLVLMIPYLFDSDKHEGEPIHQLEGEIGDSAQTAAYTMLCVITKSETEAREVFHSYDYLVPVPSHFINIALINIPEMRYKPRTKFTNEGFREKEHRGKAAKLKYEELIEEASQRIKPSAKPSFG